MLRCVGRCCCILLTATSGGLLFGRYGFVSVDDWPAVADYQSGPFVHVASDSAAGFGGAGALLEGVKESLKGA